MAIDVALIFTALGVAKSMAEFAGILDSLEAKVDRLIQSELNAGLRAIEQVAHATTEQVSLLREARGCFNKAISLEMGYRRVVALLGLSLCHHWLDDKPNCTRVLEEILEIDPVEPLKLVISGFKEIYNPFTISKQMKQQMKQVKQIKEEIVAGKGLIASSQSLFGRHPMIKYGKLVFSGRTRKEIKRELVLDAVAMSEEATAIRRIQESVSRYAGRPVSWLKALE
jgi:hypothetical protein